MDSGHARVGKGAAVLPERLGEDLGDAGMGRGWTRGPLRAQQSEYDKQRAEGGRDGVGKIRSHKPPWREELPQVQG